MAYFPEFSEYVYSHWSQRPGTLNIGWLSADHEFEKAQPSEEFLSCLWNYCKYSVGQMRGLHDCDLCPALTDSQFTERNGETLLLGGAEIRVFGKNGIIYAAPTLIFHYVDIHFYKPPEDFISALNESPAPPSEEYFQRLGDLKLEWSKTFTPAERRERRGRSGEVIPRQPPIRN